MHKKLIIFVGVFLAIVSTGFFLISTRTGETTIIETSSPEPTSSAIVETKETKTVDAITLYNLINAHRKENDLNQLRVNVLLEKSAILKVKDMIDNEYWQHEDNDSTQSWYLFTQAGYDYTVAGENLAFALNTSWDVFDSWVKSPAHNKELLTKEYEDMGVAVDCETYKKAEKHSCIVVLHLGAN